MLVSTFITVAQYTFCDITMYMFVKGALVFYDESFVSS